MNNSMIKDEDKKVTEANECSDRVVASGHICGGCPLDAYCRVSTKFAEMRKRELAEWEKDYYGK